MTLLEKANAAAPSHRKRHPPTAEQLELALAFFAGKVSANRVAYALGLAKTGGASVSAVYAASKFLRDAMTFGLVRVVKP